MYTMNILCLWRYLMDAKEAKKKSKTKAKTLDIEWEAEKRKVARKRAAMARKFCEYLIEKTNEAIDLAVEEGEDGVFINGNIIWDKKSHWDISIEEIIKKVIPKFESQGFKAEYVYMSHFSSISEHFSVSWG